MIHDNRLRRSTTPKHQRAKSRWRCLARTGIREAVRKCGLSLCRDGGGLPICPTGQEIKKARCRHVRYRPASGFHRGLFCLTPRAVTLERQGRLRRSFPCLSNMKHTTFFYPVKDFVKIFIDQPRSERLMYLETHKA